jgi:hypothetical protein
MAIEFDPTEQWDRVASELRAYKQTQQQAWGDVDNATLGRYLAGELSGEERARVEQALAQYPELLKLTDVVRDVLDEFEPTASRPPSDRPQILAFPQPRPARKPFARFFHSRGALVAAACLLLALGLSMGGVHLYTQSPQVWPPSFLGPQATRTGPDNPIGVTPSGPDKQVALSTSNKKEQEDQALAEKELTQRFAQVQKKVTVWSALTLEQAGDYYQQNGELDRAETYFVAARDLRRNAFGDDAAETIKANENLARVYQVALNTVPPEQPPLKFMAPKHAADNALHLRWRITQQDPAAIKRSVVPVLVQGFRRARTSEERQTYARALGTLGPAAADAVPDLVQVLDNTDADQERVACAWALGQMGPAGSPAVPALVETLHCDCAEARRAAGDSLVRLSPYARREVLANDKKGTELPAEVRARIEGPEGRVGVNDAGLVLTPHDFHETQRQILVLARKHNVEVYTETVARLADTDAKKVEERAKEVAANGLYLLVCKDPPGVRVVASEALKQKGFTAADLAELKKVAEEGVRQRQYDRSVVQSVGYVAQRFEPAAALSRRPNPAVGGAVGAAAKALP